MRTVPKAQVSGRFVQMTATGAISCMCCSFAALSSDPALAPSGVRVRWCGVRVKWEARDEPAREAPWWNSRGEGALNRCGARSRPEETEEDPTPIPNPCVGEELSPDPAYGDPIPPICIWGEGALRRTGESS